jgi:hypothetical protein
MQKWEGRVTEVADGFLTAEVEPLDHDGPALTADFTVDLLGPDEANVRVGDIVYVTVRTVIGPRRNKTSTSTLRLKRAGKWTEPELVAAKDRARRRHESLMKYVD